MKLSGKLQEINNWGNRSYKVGDVEIEAMDVKSVDVEWPNGETTMEIVEVKAISETVSDHGKSYRVNTRQLNVIVDLRGMPVSMPVHQLEINAVSMK